MKHLSDLIGLIMIASTLPAIADERAWITGPFDMPESAIYDETHGRIVLSVMGGHPAEADGNGSLALLSTNGAVLDAEWVTGLNAPKGMAVVGTSLLVADLTFVHEIDLATGQLLRSIDVPGAVFLNDVTSDGRRAFVSDLMANRIWLYEDGAMSLWFEGEILNHPNGLLLEGERLLVGSWGKGLRDDFSTEELGSLLSLNLSDQSVSVVSSQVGNVDGIVRIGQTLLVNDWITGQIFEIQPDGTAVEVASFAPGLADIDAYGDVLLLPSMLEGTISAQVYTGTEQ